jgi:hypothetical protein
MEDAREDPCRQAAAAGRPCFPAETKVKGEEYSVRKSLGLPDAQEGKPAAGTPPTLTEMGPYRPGLKAIPINGFSFDPGCAGKRILKSLKGKNDTYYLYRIRDTQGERVAMFDQKLVAEKFQGELAFLGKFDGECAALAAYRHESTKLPPPPAPRPTPSPAVTAAPR